MVARSLGQSKKAYEWSVTGESLTIIALSVFHTQFENRLFKPSASVGCAKIPFCNAV
jgi:hypothetical protein